MIKIFFLFLLCKKFNMHALNSNCSVINDCVLIIFVYLTNFPTIKVISIFFAIPNSYKPNTPYTYFNILIFIIFYIHIFMCIYTKYPKFKWEYILFVNIYCNLFY